MCALARPSLKNATAQEKDWRLAVDEYMSVRGHPDVFAIGDCSGTGLPATAQAAAQEAKALVRNLNSQINGGAPVPFKVRRVVLFVAAAKDRLACSTITSCRSRFSATIAPLPIAGRPRMAPSRALPPFCSGAAPI